jgi:pyrimidine-nucleoside phosphorylase
MHVPTLIERKRDGEELAPNEIAALVDGFTGGEVPDYQMSAFAMAVFFQGMTPNETRELTRAMLRSGRVLSYPKNSPPKVDKHSTGGIGDKVSLVLAPLLACDEVWVPMISGRGLGITGGTLDKLESIPGFNINLEETRALRQLERIRVFMIGQTADICPADKKLYALRDVTGTVPSQPLIVASVMSKKLAESLDRLVLDVKFGSGAFMKSQVEAAQLAEAMSAVGEQMGVAVSHLLSPMEEPIGRTVGNALEVAEAVDTLQGRGPDDLLQLTLDLAAALAIAPRTKLQSWLNDGSAWKKFIELIEAQDGDARALTRMGEIHSAPIVHSLPAPAAGVVRRMDAGMLGRAALFLGAGRARVEDAIDFAVGFSSLKKIGEKTEAREPLLKIHARTERDLAAVLPLIEEAITVEQN